MDFERSFILTEGGIGIGFGHLTRCISLYQAFEERGIKPRIIVNADDSAKALLKGKDFQIYNWLKEKNKLFRGVTNSGIIIVDSYLADISFYKEISQLTEVPVYIDDIKRLYYPKGIVINGSIYAEKLSYPKKQGVTYLLGTKYTPLRREFWGVDTKKIKRDVQRIMITFGGNDKENMTPRTLRFLDREFPELIKNVVIGVGYKNTKEIEGLKDKAINLIYYPDSRRIKELILEADIAISAGGQTLYELARTGTPTIALAVAKNQLNNIKGWRMTGFIEYAGWCDNINVFRNIKIFIDRLRNRDTRKNKSRIGRMFVDGKGSYRIVDYLLKVIK